MQRWFLANSFASHPPPHTNPFQFHGFCLQNACCIQPLLPSVWPPSWPGSPWIPASVLPPLRPDLYGSGAGFQKGCHRWSLSSCFTPAILGMKSTLFHPCPWANMTLALQVPGTAPHPFPPTLHSTLQPCPLRSLNKPRGQPSGLGLAVPSVIPGSARGQLLSTFWLCSGDFPQSSVPRPRPRGSLSYHPLFSSQHVPQLGIILCAVCWPVRCKFYKGNSLNYLGHHHVPQPAGGYGYMGEWLAGWRGGWRAG